MAEKIQVVVADDHPIVRKGLREIIEEEPDVKVMAEAGDGEAGLALIRKLQPHIAILDLDMPRLDGFAVAGEIRRQGLPVEIVFLTVHSEADLLQRAMDLGGKGFIVKESAVVDIVNGIRSVAEGRPFVSPSMTAALLQRRARGTALERQKPGLDNLTPSERRILAMIASGKVTKEIATELHIHPRTVETHRASICQKLQLSGANSLLRFALEHKTELAA
jgi:DNA-binding NarL/FixJ family response regulator